MLIDTTGFVVGVRQPERVYRLAHPFADDERPLERLLSKQDEQILAAIALGRIASAARASERVGECAQGVVSGLVAVLVVEGFDERVQRGLRV
ncbi:MAG: hypothetical protein QOJ29_2194 [Thermoleophilaceae bacterium]|jgi:hypothetical protein|nr:hypothetical protein [Thermoleophilaceae bacterium]